MKGGKDIAIIIVLILALVLVGSYSGFVIKANAPMDTASTSCNQYSTLKIGNDVAKELVNMGILNLRNACMRAVNNQFRYKGVKFVFYDCSQEDLQRIISSCEQSYPLIARKARAY